jgi:microcystin-dependent protein
MARREYTSGRPTTLASPFAIGAGTFTIADDGSEVTWPTGADHPFWVTIDAGTAQEERVLCSGRSVRVVTVASGGRGQDGTSESNHSAGATVWPSWSATDADESNEHINLTTGVHGYSATAAEINILDGATLSTAELNILDGVTATTAELNYTDGVTSPIQTQINTNTPVGTIVMYGGTSNPTGWLLCNGQSTAGYTALAAVVGANVPDLMGRAPIGYGAGTGLTERTTIGAKTGAETVTLTAAQSGLPQHSHPNTLSDPGHSHTIDPPNVHSALAANWGSRYGAPEVAYRQDYGQTIFPSVTGVTISNANAGPSAASEAHTNVQPSTVVNFIIKT